MLALHALRYNRIQRERRFLVKNGPALPALALSALIRERYPQDTLARAFRNPLNFGVG